MARLLAIVTTIFALLWFYIWAHLVAPAALWADWRPGSAVGVAVVGTWQLVTLVRSRRTARTARQQMALFGSYAVFLYLWLATMLRDLLQLAAGQVPELAAWWTRESAAINSVLLFGAVASGVLGIVVTLRGPRVRAVAITLPRWPVALRGLGIAQISDLHIGPLIGADYVRRVVASTMACGADLIVITGDLGDGRVEDHGAAIAALRDLRAPLGVYFVTGNHEYYWDAAAWTRAVQDVGITPLLNRGVEIRRGNAGFWLGGVPDISSRHHAGEAASDPQLALPPPALTDVVKILLAHQPQSCFAAEAAGFDLMLCGHTHNGQAFPFNLIVGRFNPFAKGLNRQGSLQVYVNAGTGFWGPPTRLGVPAEITRFTMS